MLNKCLEILSKKGYFAHAAAAKQMSAQDYDGPRRLLIAEDTPAVQDVLLMGKNKAARRLIERGVDVNKAEDGGITPLMRLALSGDDVAMAQLLLDHGAAIDAKDSSGNTALMSAVAFECEKMVSLLLERGADITAKNNFGRGMTDFGGDDTIAENLKPERARRQAALDAEKERARHDTVAQKQQDLKTRAPKFNLRGPACARWTICAPRS